MVKLKTITATNFKNIANAKIKFQDFNVLVGPNGSGKSNFLNIIPFLNFIINGATDDVKEFLEIGYGPTFSFIKPDTLHFLQNNTEYKTQICVTFSDWEESILFKYELELGSNIHSKYIYGLTILKETFTYKEKSKPGSATSIFSRTGRKIRFNEEIKKISVIDEVPDEISVIRLFNITLSKLNNSIKSAILHLNELLQTDVLFLSNYVLKHNKAAEYSRDNRIVNIKINEQIVELNNSDNWTLFKDAIKNIANIDDIKIEKSERSEKPTFTIFYTQYGNPSQILSELSDGTVLLIALVVKIFNSDKSIIFIEELENSIHPKALSNLISFLRSMSLEKQFVISSHSGHLLNMVDPSEVFVFKLEQFGMSTVSEVKNLKELKRKLNDGYISFGDLLFQNIDGNEF